VTPLSFRDIVKQMRAANPLMAIAILLLLGVAAWQQLRINTLSADLAQAQRDLAFKAETLAKEKLHGRREELVAAVAFLDDLYRSNDGLQRPGGLYAADAQKVDAEAIGTWILDVYMKSRIEGKSDAEARQSITDAIKGSDEWRRKHAK
jgi:hypothetical protein